MELVFSTIEEDDLVDCSELYAATFREPPWNEGWNMEDAYERISSYLSHPKSVAIKVSANEQICGFVFGKIQQWNSYTSYDLEEMCVSKAFHRKGIGKALIAELEASLMEKGVSKIYLVTQRASIPSYFYSSLAFSEERDLIIMVKSLEVDS